ncbi:hypothetical protein CVT25_001886 [Psilocybe cyanescens]|uniref:Uncharacterized protein n=1 Tax=Psilocybe cyanescens TaxID=93625 RepID=A0A409WQV4_PSICY|nr:hypothetical protein CVT25_001886 [Psilocybe cyanescens]
MSSPIAIPRSNKASSASPSSSASESGSYTSSSPATSYLANSASSSPAKGLYVPVHKRSPSSGSPTSSLVSLPTQTTTPTTPHPRIYSLPFLFSLRPNAQEGIKEKIRAGPAPELLMNRRMRKNLEFAEHQHRRVSPTRAPAPAAAAAAPTPTPIPTPTQAPVQKASQSPRITPRRNRFGPRAPERRKHALQSSLGSWRHDTGLHLPAAPHLAVL